MLRETILQLSKAAEARKPALLVKIAAAAPTSLAEQPGDDAVRQFRADRSYNSVEEGRGRGSTERANRAALQSSKEKVESDNAGAKLLARQMETDRAPVDSRSDSAIMTQQGLRQTTPDSLPSWLTPVGYGAGAGALAGIPLGLLYRAIFSDDEDKTLSGYLRSALLGGLIGGGVGGLGGAGARALYQNSPTGSYAIDQVLGRLPPGMAERSLGALQEE